MQLPAPAAKSLPHQVETVQFHQMTEVAVTGCTWADGKISPPVALAWGTLLAPPEVRMGSPHHHCWGFAQSPRIAALATNWRLWAGEWASC